ncbi:MAG: putative Dual specificity protein kinase pom1, partial [Streblomastix strix]
PTDDKTKKPDKLETTKVPGGVGKAVEKNNALDTPKSVSRVNVPQPTVIEPCNLCNTGQLQILNLKLISAPFTTGIEENEEFVATPGMLIAQRFRVVEYIGSAAFSQAIECEDIETGDHVCMKIIKNNKEYFDQSVDEIKLLHYVNVHDPEDRFHLVRMYDYFYYKEHLFIMCELLKDNLYEYQKYCNENNLPNYFTIPRLQRIAKQVLEALAFLHSLGLMHCDLKPENILIRSFSRCEVKVIDFGSSCFVTDPLSFYTQSRSYRAPEVILGVPYGRKIDIWSLGCILVEMLTGRVLFLNESLQTLLGRVTAICGQVPPEMLSRAKFRMRYFTPRGMLYELLGVDSDSGVSSDDDDEDDDDEDDDEDGDDEDEEERERKRQMKKNTHKKKTQNQRPKSGEPQYHFLYPKTTTLQQRMHTDDLLFVDFVTRLLTVDPDRRPTAIEALQHPWFNVIYPQSE